MECACFRWDCFVKNKLTEMVLLFRTTSQPVVRETPYKRQLYFRRTLLVSASAAPKALVYSIIMVQKPFIMFMSCFALVRTPHPTSRRRLKLKSRKVRTQSQDYSSLRRKDLFIHTRLMTTNATAANGKRRTSSHRRSAPECSFICHR